MKRSLASVAIGFIGVLVACAHAPTKPGERADLIRDARSTLARMEAKDPSLGPLLDQSAGYIVFPHIGEGGFLIGGGGGQGVVFQRGHHVTGFATIEHLAAGALAGGQKYAELVVVKDPQALEEMKGGRYDFAAQASAVILRSGAAAAGTPEKAVSVFIDPIKGAMVNASVSGQKIRFSM